jgi:cell division protein FtsI (penicillin-binding protein 3)
MTNPRSQSVSGNSKRRSRKTPSPSQPSRQEVRRRRETPKVTAEQPKAKKAQVKPKAKPAPLSKLRLLMVWGVLLGGIFGLGWRLYQLQIIQAADLQKKARQQQTYNLRPYIPRRTIVDSQGNVLATDRLNYTLYVHPKLFKKSQEEIANQLAKIIEKRPTQAFLTEFRKKDTGIKLETGLTEAQAQKIRHLRLDGLDLNEEYARFYPQEEMAGDIIGYVDREREGQAGLESSQRDLLERNLLNLRIRRTGKGSIMPAFLPEGILQFDDLDLQLTLDMRLQRAARTALRQQLQKFNAKRGAVIVMDATDGSLLALVCEPTYDPNQYYKSQVELFKNWTVSDLYEPGSTFKPVNIAIALDKGAIDPNTTIYDSGAITVDGWQIFNASKAGNGSLNIAGVLQTSSNIGMVQIMQRLDKHYYYQQLQKIKLDKKTGVDLPGEASGHLKNEAEFTSRSIEAATAAFGQGFSLTPIKLIQLHGSLANGGKLVTPHLVRGLVDPEGHLHWKPAFPVSQIFSEKTSHTVVEMMETVVSQGTGAPAKIAGYRIGGKTGTAQKAGPRGGYISGAKITSFVAILPVNSPRYVVLAVVDEPKGGNTFGSTVAAPIVKNVMEALISLKGIPPSNFSDNQPEPTPNKKPIHD